MLSKTQEVVAESQALSAPHTYALKIRYDGLPSVLIKNQIDAYLFTLNNPDSKTNKARQRITKVIRNYSHIIKSDEAILKENFDMWKAACNLMAIETL